MRHPRCRLQCVAGHCYYPLSLFFLSFFFLRLLLLTHFRETPVCEIISPQYFGITRRYMQKKIFFGGKFYFLKKKRWFFRPFFCWVCNLILTLLDDLCNNKKIWVNFIFLRKKRWFFGRFSAFYGQRSVTAAWATRSPWSIVVISIAWKNSYIW